VSVVTYVPAVAYSCAGVVAANTAKAMADAARDPWPSVG